MPATHLGHPVVPHRRIRARATPVLIDDSAAVRTADHSSQDSGRPPDRLPRATWQHGVLMGITAAIGVWFAIDLINAIGHPEVISGHLRGALVAAIVTLTVTMSNWRTYRRIERLHSRWRDTTEWWADRAAIIDQRDEKFRARQIELIESQRAFARGQHALAEDMMLVGRAVADLCRAAPEITAAIRYTNTSLTTIGRQVISIGGGQAVVHGAVEHLATSVAQLIEGQRRAALNPGDNPGEEPDDDTWRVYLRAIKDADDLNSGG